MSSNSGLRIESLASFATPLTKHQNLLCKSAVVVVTGGHPGQASTQELEAWGEPHRHPFPLAPPPPVGVLATTQEKLPAVWPFCLVGKW